MTNTQDIKTGTIVRFVGESTALGPVLSLDGDIVELAEGTVLLDQIEAHTPPSADIEVRMTNIHPTKAGQLVQDSNGRQGITTDAPSTRTPRVAVQIIGSSYPVMRQLSELTVITTISSEA